MSKSIIIFNREDFTISIAIQFFQRFFRNVLIIDKYDLYAEEELEKLEKEIFYLKETHNDIRLLFFIDMCNSGVNIFMDARIFSKHRTNIVFFNVEYNDTARNILNSFNKVVKGTTVFGWLVGDKDSDGEIINDVQISEVFFAWLLILESGGLSDKTDQDVFFFQQNARNDSNHLFVLIPKIVFNDSFQSSLSSIIYSSKKMFKSFDQKKNLLEGYNFQNPFFSLIDEKDSIEFNPPHYPTYDNINNFKDIEEFNQKLENILVEFEQTYISPMLFRYTKDLSSIFKNEFNQILNGELDAFKSELLSMHNTKETMNFNSMDKYIQNTLGKLKEYLNNNYVLPSGNLVATTQSLCDNIVRSILELTAKIDYWKSKNNINRYVKYAVITGAFILSFILLLLHIVLSLDFNLNILIVSLFLSSVTTAAFWWWQYTRKLNKLINALKNKKNSISKIIERTIKEYVANIPYVSGKYLSANWSKKVYRKLLIELQMLQNGLHKTKQAIFELNQRMSLFTIDEKTSLVRNDVVYGLIYNETIKSYSLNEFKSVSDMNNSLIEKLVELINMIQKEKMNERDIQFQNLNSSMSYPIDLRFLTKIDIGKTNPVLKERFIIKPTNQVINSVTDKVVEVNSNIALSNCEYYQVEVNSL